MDLAVFIIIVASTASVVAIPLLVAHRRGNRKQDSATADELAAPKRREVE